MLFCKILLWSTVNRYPYGVIAGKRIVAPCPPRGHRLAKFSRKQLLFVFSYDANIQFGTDFLEFLKCQQAFTKQIKDMFQGNFAWDNMFKSHTAIEEFAYVNGLICCKSVAMNLV